MSTQRKSFTLIELLIVVAIIAILAAIAVPNFLEAQVRSKVSRCKADERSVATGLEAYFVDNSMYPFVVPTDPANKYCYIYIQYALALTTPVAYMTSGNLTDPFCPAAAATRWGPAPVDWRNTFEYINYCDFWEVEQAGPTTSFNLPPKKAFMVASLGPRNNESELVGAGWPSPEWIPICFWETPPDPATAFLLVYDASNGTRSYGAIVRFGGDVAGMPQTY